MKIRSIICTRLFLIFIVLTAARASVDLPEATTLPVVLVSLRDGTGIKGAPAAQLLPLRTQVGEVKIPVTIVKTMTFGTAPKPLLVTMVNGDRLSGQLELTSLDFATLAGTATIETSLIQAIAALPDTSSEQYLPPAHDSGAPPVAPLMLGRPAHAVALQLADGSSVMATTTTEFITLATSFTTAKIPLPQVASVALMEDHEHAAVLLKNGDRLTGVVDLGSLEFSTCFGMICLDLANLRQLIVRHPGEPPPSLCDRLILNYNFDDTGTRATDRSGKEYHGTWNGQAVYVEGRLGKTDKAAEFNGVDTFLDISAVKDSLPRERHTIAFWVRPDAEALKKSTIFSNWCRETIGFRDGKLLASLPVADRANVGNQAATLDLTGVAPSLADVWMHVVVTFEKGKAGTLYLNGTKVASQSETLGYGIAWYEQNFTVGRIKDFGNDREYFKGRLDDLMIFDAALTDDEVSLLFSAM